MEKLTFIFKSGKEISVVCEKWKLTKGIGNDLVGYTLEGIVSQHVRYIRMDDVSAILSETIDEIEE